jgi:hypothetical protein
MKKVAIIFLLLNFLIANTGMAISVHYCGGKLTSTSLFSFDKHPCKCGKKAMKKGCCQDRTTFFKVKNDLSKVDHVTLKVPSSKVKLPIFRQIDFSLNTEPNYFVSHFYHLPPIRPKVPLYLLDKVFLI